MKFFLKEFKIEDFLKRPTLDKFHKCTKENLIAIADHFEIQVSGQSLKQVINTEILSALSQKVVLSYEPAALKSPTAKGSRDESLRLKELELWHQEFEVH